MGTGRSSCFVPGSVPGARTLSSLNSNTALPPLPPTTSSLRTSLSLQMRRGKPSLGKFPFSPPRADSQSTLPSGHPCPEPPFSFPIWEAEKERVGGAVTGHWGLLHSQARLLIIKQDEPFPSQLIKTSGQRLQMKGPCQVISLANEATAQASFPLLNLINSAVDPGARGCSACLVLAQVAGTFQLA